MAKNDDDGRRITNNSKAVASHLRDIAVLYAFLLKENETLQAELNAYKNAAKVKNETPRNK